MKKLTQNIIHLWAKMMPCLHKAIFPTKNPTRCVGYLSLDAARGTKTRMVYDLGKSPVDSDGRRGHAIAEDHEGFAAIRVSAGPKRSVLVN